jgi:uncharacterized Rmd1/YagE family protein
MDKQIFKGNIYFFYGFDVGEDIEIKELSKKYPFIDDATSSLQFFKSYHKPVIIDTNKINISPECHSGMIYNFGAISLKYKISFEKSLNELKTFINTSKDNCNKDSINDARTIFNLIHQEIRQARFFHISKSYAVIQIDHIDTINPYEFKEKFGDELTSVLRFENENLSEYKKNQILEDAFGYYRGDLLLIDFGSTLIYDNDYKDILEIIEFANIRHMELQYFDQSLDKQLNFVYERQVYKIPLKAYFPLYGMSQFNPIAQLAKLRVDISVVSEKLWNTIKFSDEPYYVEIYQIISNRLGFQEWQNSIDKKLEIIRHILEVYEHKVSAVREDLLNILVILLISVEVIMAIIK